jgi:Methyltransferase domain
MDQCRNCGSLETCNLGFIGTIAPFFLKRVLHAEVVTRRSTQPRKRAIQNFTQFMQRIVSRLQPPAVAVELLSCKTCSFVQTRFPFPEEGIRRLYEDYRSESYNRERAIHEPHYSAVADQIGSHTENGATRVDAITTWIASKIDLDTLSLLDYGGADGKYLPHSSGPKFVFEISSIPPAAGVERISDEAALQSYGYVQLSHVLEHVSDPLRMVRHVATFVQPGGYLLLEVPQDIDTPTLRQLQTGITEGSITVHEHINFYSSQALQSLIQAAGLQVAALDAIHVDTPLGKQVFVRGLAQRPAL